MNNLSLKSKIIFTISLPLVFVLYFAGSNILSQYSNYTQSNYAIESANEIMKISDLINNLQVERGMSASYLSGGDILNQLKNHREKVDSALGGLNLSSPVSGVSKDLKETLEKLRPRINDKNIAIGEVVGAYTKEILKALESYNLMSHNINDESIRYLVQNLVNLENARENGGKLRANISGILISKQPISDDRLMQVFSFFQLTESFLTMSLNQTDVDIHDELNLFLKGDDWSKVRVAMLDVVQNYRTGSFQENGGNFFKTITSSLGLLQNSIQGLLTSLVNQAQMLKNEQQSYLFTATISLCLLIFGITFVALKLSSQITRSLIFIVDQLNSRASLLKETCGNLKHRSTTLSAASNEQAASLTETATALEEVAAMISKTTNAVNLSAKASQHSLASAENGEVGINEMSKAIIVIEETMRDIQDQVIQGKEDIALIGGLIEQIQEKTAVINDIVFQTKLLSFNASVEASRAGEHGKGFSIVAGEVGRLAEMSGTQAKEISEIIKSSVEKVHAIVAATDSRLVNIREKSKSSIDIGNEKSLSCQEVLKVIKATAMEVDGQLVDVNVASQEQLRGVDEIRTAMNELDQTTNQNAQVAQEVKDASDSMELVGTEIVQSITQLKELTFGSAS